MRNSNGFGRCRRFQPDKNFYSTLRNVNQWMICLDVTLHSIVRIWNVSGWAKFIGLILWGVIINKIRITLLNSHLKKNKNWCFIFYKALFSFPLTRLSKSISPEKFFFKYKYDTYPFSPGSGSFFDTFAAWRLQRSDHCYLFYNMSIVGNIGYTEDEYRNTG